MHKYECIEMSILVSASIESSPNVCNVVYATLVYSP